MKSSTNQYLDLLIKAHNEIHPKNRIYQHRIKTYIGQIDENKSFLDVDNYMCISELIINNKSVLICAQGNKDGKDLMQHKDALENTILDTLIVFQLNNITKFIK